MLKPAVLIFVLLMCSLPAFAGGGFGAISDPQGHEYSGKYSKVSFANFVLELGAKLTDGIAKTGSLIGALTSKSSPSATGAAGSLIEPVAKIAVEIAITDYKVSRHQQQQIKEWAPMVKAEMLTHKEVLDIIMASNYTGGAGRANVDSALRSEVENINK